MSIFGPDVSHYQAGIDLRRAAAEGHQFAIIKISQGAGFRDGEWARHRDNARAAGLLTIGYHYVTTDTPARQAGNCAAAIGDKAIPLALDWEEGGGNWANFLATLAAFRAAGLNVRLAYCPRWYWQQQGSPDMSSCRLPLWSSRYPSTLAGDPAVLYRAVTATHWAGYGGLSVGLVQFSDRASIAGRAIDCSAFNGTRVQLERLLGLTPTATEEDSLAQVPQEQWAKVYRQETAALDYRAHHGQPTDDQLGHVLSTRLELNRRLDQVLAALVELTARVAKIEGTK